MRRIPLFALASNVVAYVVQAAGLPSQPYGYEIPMRDAAPWPIFRRDERNTGNSPLPPFDPISAASPLPLGILAGVKMG